MESALLVLDDFISFASSHFSNSSAQLVRLSPVPNGFKGESHTILHGAAGHLFPQLTDEVSAHHPSNG